MKTFMSAIALVFLLSAHVSAGQTTSYQPPAHNYHQNNWMSGAG